MIDRADPESATNADDAIPDRAAASDRAAPPAPAAVIDAPAHVAAIPASPVNPAAIVDSSALVALADRDDTSHAAAVAVYQELVAAGYRLFTTSYVVAETYELLRTGLGVAVARQWLRESRIAVYHVTEADEAQAKRMLLAERGRPDLSLTDATSLVVMERLGVSDAFAVDQHFLAETS